MSFASEPGQREPTGWPEAIRLTVPVVAGVWLGHVWPSVAAWLLLALLGLVLGWRHHFRPASRANGRQPPSRNVAVLLVVCLLAAYTAIRLHKAPTDTVERYVTADGQLAEVVGTIASPPRLTSPDDGFFAEFGYERPKSVFTLNTEQLVRHDQTEPLSGNILVKIDEAMLDLREGQRVRLLGWLGDVGPTKNPGEFDYRRWLRSQGVVGRLSVTARSHVARLDGNGEVKRATESIPALPLSERVNRAARTALSTGMAGEPERLALLETLLLGRSQRSLDDLHETFRRVGMAHILSISGAHLGILVLLTWALARACSGSPRLVATVVLLVVLAYAWMLPTRVPIIRATIMASAFFLPAALGRHVKPTRAFAFAAIAVLLWRPGELFAAGFQLSFAAVAAIMAFAKPVSRRLWPEPLVPVRHPTPLLLFTRAAVDYLAVSIAAFVAVLPIVAYHFGVVSPLAVLLSLLAWPALVAVLALGYLKILVGLALPSAGLLLSGPLGWAVDGLVTLAERADTWPGSSFTLRQPVGVAWALVATAFGFFLLANGLKQRRSVIVALTVFVSAWFVWEQGIVQRWLREKPAMSITMLAVGDGSCLLVQSGDETLLFDCGSQNYPQVGRRSVVPALHRLGVKRIDTLVLSHADLDHFSGVPDLVKAVPIGRVLCSPEVLAEAKAHPDRATAKLVNWLADEQLAPQPVTAGWTEALGRARAEALWPMPGFVAERSNDHSLVLRFEAGGHTALLTGDIQEDAMSVLFDDDAARAKLDVDAADLPHHGSFTDASAAWLDALSPDLVLQSSGPDRLRDDRWAPVLAGQPIRRFVSDRRGMTAVQFFADGRVDVEPFISTVKIDDAD